MEGFTKLEKNTIQVEEDSKQGPYKTVDTLETSVENTENKHETLLKFSDIDKVDESFYTSKKENSLYFMMERVDSKNLATWTQYTQIQFDTARYLLTKGEAYKPDSPFYKYKDLIRGTDDPVDKFKACLKFHDKSEVWVAYVSNKPSKNKYKLTDTPYIEMTMTVLTSAEVPFQLHMGISRGMSHLKSKVDFNKGLAIRLHAFAAQVMKKRNPKKAYMITTPLPLMKKILTDSLPKGTYEEGHNTQYSLIHTQSDGTTDYSKDYSSPYNNNFKFSLRNQEGHSIFEVNGDDAGSKYWWFFANIQPSLAHPYVTVYLDYLSSIY